MRRSTASLREIVWSSRSRNFESRLSLIAVVWLWVLTALGHKLGVITQSHSQAVHHTLDTADVIVGLRVLAAAQLGDLLHNLRWLWLLTEFSFATC